MQVCTAVVLALAWRTSSSADTNLARDGALVSFAVDGRDIDAWVPSCAGADGTKSPLILSLHAWGTGRKLQQQVDRFPQYIGSECAIIVYPQGKKRGFLFGAVGFSWNAGGCCPSANDGHVDDVSFLRKVISVASKKFPIDERAIFTVGISNGAMMANRLACSDTRIKAMVVLSGGLVNGTEGDSSTETFSCSRSLPVLHFHGLKDVVVPFTGCNKTFGGLDCQTMQRWAGMAPFPSILDYVGHWRARNGIPTKPGKQTFQNGSATCSSWGEEASNVTLCTSQYEGHAWPGVCNTLQKILPFMLNCTLDIDASHHAMEFIRRYIPSSSSSGSIVV